jgi:hypothetical protein
VLVEKREQVSGQEGGACSELHGRVTREWALTPSKPNAFSMASDAAAGVVGAVVNPFKHENNASASCSGVAASAPLPLEAIVAVWCWQWQTLLWRNSVWWNRVFKIETDKNHVSDEINKQAPLLSQQCRFRLQEEITSAATTYRSH